MKKISLKNLPVDSKEMLTKEQLKNVLGGDGYTSGNCCASGPYQCCSTTDKTQCTPCRSYPPLTVPQCPGGYQLQVCGLWV